MDMKAFFENNREHLNRIYPAGCDEERYMRLYDLFVKQFNAQPDAFFSAPGRTEVAGNHTDHNNGAVLAASVDLDTVAAVRANGSNSVTLYSEGYPESFVVELDDLTVHPEESGSTSALIRGVAARMKELGYKIGGYDAYVTSNVFSGSGLSSSAAFEVMLTAVFEGLFGNPSISPMEKAVISRYCENVYFGKPCGLLDQAASATGGLVFMDFGTTPTTVKAVAYDFAKKGYALCVVAAGGDHGDLTDAYAAIPAEMKAVAATMGKTLLNEITPEELWNALPALKGRVPDRAILRALHFMDETRRAKTAAEALERDDLEGFFADIIASGESSWKLLQNLYVPERDNQEIPLALEMSRRMLQGRGAWRVHGGGFAGTILSFVPVTMVETYKKTMNAVFGENAVTVLNVRPEGSVMMK